MSVSIFDGYNSLTNKRLNSCVNGTVKVDEIIESKTFAQIISCEQDYNKDFCLEASVNAGLPPAAICLQTELNISASKSIKTKGLYYVLHFIRYEKTEQAINTSMAPDKINLLQNDRDRFFELAGNEYISQIRWGRQFFAIVEFHLDEKSIENIFKAKKQVKALNLADFKLLLSKQRGKKTNEISCTFHCEQAGLPCNLPQKFTSWGEIQKWISIVSEMLSEKNTTVSALPLKALWYCKESYKCIANVNSESIKGMEAVVSYANKKLQLISDAKHLAELCIRYITLHNLETKKANELEELNCFKIALIEMEGNIKFAKLSELLNIILNIKIKGVTAGSIKITLQEVINGLKSIRDNCGRIFKKEYPLSSFKKKGANIKLKIPKLLLEDTGWLSIQLFDHALKIVYNEYTSFLDKFKSKEDKDITDLKKGDGVVEKDLKNLSDQPSPPPTETVKIFQTHLHAKNKTFAITANNDQLPTTELNNKKLMVRIEKFSNERLHHFVDSDSPVSSSRVHELQSNEANELENKQREERLQDDKKKHEEKLQDEKKKREEKLQADQKINEEIKMKLEEMLIEVDKRDNDRRQNELLQKAIERMHLEKLEYEIKLKIEHDNEMQKIQDEVRQKNIELAKSTCQRYKENLGLGIGKLQLIFKTKAKRNRLDQLKFLSDLAKLLEKSKRNENGGEHNLIIIGAFLQLKILLKEELKGKAATTALITIEEQLKHVLESFENIQWSGIVGHNFTPNNKKIEKAALVSYGVFIKRQKKSAFNSVVNENIFSKLSDVDIEETIQEGTDQEDQLKSASTVHR